MNHTKYELKQRSDVAYRKRIRFTESWLKQKLIFLIIFPIFFDSFKNGLTGKAGESYVQLFVAKLL
jgi:hypothetical protein